MENRKTESTMLLKLNETVTFESNLQLNMSHTEIR